MEKYPASKLKLDELFVYWLSQKNTAGLIKGYINSVLEGRAIEKPQNSQLILNTALTFPTTHPPSPIGAATSIGNISPIHPPKSPSHKDWEGSPVKSKSSARTGQSPRRFEKIRNFGFDGDDADSQINKSQFTVNKSSSCFESDLSSFSNRDELSNLLPKFYFTEEGGRGRGSPILADRLESRLVEINDIFGPFNPIGMSSDDFAQVTKTLCGFPSFFNAILFRKILSGGFEGNEPNNSTKSPSINFENAKITFDMFCAYWKKEIEPFDVCSRFFRLLRGKDPDSICREDFEPFIRELLLYHPGLEFLESHSDFHPKYMTTVITRIFYCVNTSGSGRITERELRRSNLVDSFISVDEEEDINKVTDYFSYEHFYVLFCRFYELDTDRDGKISREDLLKYGEHGLSKAIVDRVFQVGRRPFEMVDGAVVDRSTMTYEDFIFFMLSEEDKTNPISLNYWFRCVDLDENGVIVLMELKYFYEIQEHRMECLGHEIVNFRDLICQMWDLIRLGDKKCILLSDFKHPHAMKTGGVLFDTLFNLNKFIGFEQRDPFSERQKRNDPFETEWDRFAFHDYNRLAAEDEREQEADSMEIELSDEWINDPESKNGGGRL